VFALFFIKRCKKDGITDNENNDYKPTLNIFSPNFTLLDSIQGMIFQLFQYITEGGRLKNQPFL